MNPISSFGLPRRASSRFGCASIIQTISTRETPATFGSRTHLTQAFSTRRLVVLLCLLPLFLLTVVRPAIAQRPTMRGPDSLACVDGTPHRERYVQVDHRVKLQVLDWGGSDKPRTMLLLTGLGDNAHVYDQFAFQFTNDFHVIGVTRRGYLPSSVAESGYDVATRVRDDIAVLDALNIERAVVVGHSVAGSELTGLALDYPHRVEAVVYLDSYDLSRRFELADIPPAPLNEGDGASLQAYLASSQRLDDTLRPAQAVCFGVEFARDGSIANGTTPSWVPEAILHGIQASQNPSVDWSRVSVPRLGLFNMPSVEERLPYYSYLDQAGQVAFDSTWPAIVDWYADRINDFGVEHVGKPKPVVYTLPSASHYFYLNQQAFVVRAMRKFLLGGVR